MSLAALTPAEFAAALAARRDADASEAERARDFWLIISAARAGFAAGRMLPVLRGLAALRYRLARATLMRDRAWIRRYAAAEADLEARARALQDGTCS